MQDAQIFSICTGRRPLVQAVVGAAKCEGREQVITVAIGGKGSGFAYQRADQMAIINRMLGPSMEPGQCDYEIDPLSWRPQTFEAEVDPLSWKPQTFEANTSIHGASDGSSSHPQELSYNL